ncbi:MAG TPA: DUF4097 family beta strand repeat-containing protein [Bacillales bacterium]|nr:DUF4097 family beta strand repeat-containing protein [Bacillales bacterium]
MGKETFLRKMKRYVDDLDEVFGGERRTESDSVDMEGIEELGISTGEADVVIHTHESDFLDLYLDTYEGGPTLETNMSGTKLRVEVQGRKSGITLGRRFYSELQVYIPKRVLDGISVDTQSGDIAMKDVEVSRVGLKSDSGEVEIEGVRALEASLKTKSGEMEIKGFESESLSFASDSGEVSLSDIRGDVHGKTRSGEITVDHCEGMDIHLKNKSGGVEVENVTAEKLSISTISGEIEVDELRVREASLDSRSGEITGRHLVGDIRSTTTSGEVELEFEEAGRNIFVETSSGEIELRQKGEGWNAEVHIQTNSGDIEVPTEAVGTQGNHDFEGTIGMGEGRIELKSLSGDIEVF